MSQHHLSKDRRRHMVAAQVARTGSRGLARIIERNTNTICDIQERMRRDRSIQDRIADAITTFSGSMGFVYLHAVWFAGWILVNLGGTPLRVFDPYPFGLLTMIVSLEAIFLATFVLVSQNRMADIADKRADLDLQIDLLAEYEVTRLLSLMDAVADHLGVKTDEDSELDELKNEVSPEKVMAEMDRVRKNAAAQSEARTQSSDLPSD